MSATKHKLKQIWRQSTLAAIVVFIVLIPTFLSIDAEFIPAIILSAVSAVVLWHAIIVIGVRLLVPELSEYVNDARVERVHDDIEVESSTRKTGDSELDKYVEDYARARDFWGKTGMLLLVGLFLALLYFVFGVP